MNQEVIQAKKIISKALNKHSKEKKKSETLGRDVKNLKEKMNNLKKTAKNYNDKLNNDDDFVNYVDGYLNIENNENDFEEEEEKEENDESSDDGKYKDWGEGNSKAKLEEYEKLNKKYDDLKNQIKKCEDIINKYKLEYKNYKEKLSKNKNAKDE